MDIPIILSSSQSTSGPTHDFSTKIIPPIILDQNKKYKVGLIKLSMSYSWMNITEKYKNTEIKYSHDNGTTWTSITFQDGNYTYQNIQDYINSQIVTTDKHKPTLDGKESLAVKLTFDLTTLKIILFLADNFRLDLTEGNFHQLLGFEAKIYTTAAISKETPNITNSIDSILVNCSLISDSILFGQSSDALECIDISGLPLSYPFHYRPRIVLFHGINLNVINDIRIYITDVLYRPIDLNNTPVDLTLLLREVEK